MIVTFNIKTLIELSRTGEAKLNQILNNVQKNGIENIDKDDLFFMIKCYAGKISTYGDYAHDIYKICNDHALDITNNEYNSFLELLGAFGELVELYKKVKYN